MSGGGAGRFARDDRQLAQKKERKRGWKGRETQLDHCHRLLAILLYRKFLVYDRGPFPQCVPATRPDRIEFKDWSRSSERCVQRLIAA